MNLKRCTEPTGGRFSIYGANKYSLTLLAFKTSFCPIGDPFLFYYPIKDIDSNRQYKIVAGFNKTKLEEFIDHDWINWSGELPSLFNKHLVDKIQSIYPHDFITLPVTIS